MNPLRILLAVGLAFASGALSALSEILIATAADDRESDEDEEKRETLH
jgi:hypothetical protein